MIQTNGNFLFCSIVPPEENTFYLVTSGTTYADNQISFTCKTSSTKYTPGGLHVIWSIGVNPSNTFLASYVDEEFESSLGENGGNVITSRYTFLAERQYDGKYVSCTPSWNGHDLPGLRRSRQITVLCK